MVNLSSYCGNICPLEVLERMIFAEGRNESNSHMIASYEGRIESVVRYLKYKLKVEILRNDLGSANEYVSEITLNGKRFGGCNPDGQDYDCTFYDCASDLIQNTIASNTGSINATLYFQGHSSDCDCDEDTWECSREYTKPSRTPMTAVARITLTPLLGSNILHKYNYSLGEKIRT